MKKQTPAPKKAATGPMKKMAEPEKESYYTKRMLGLLGTKSGTPGAYDLDKIKMKPKAPESKMAKEMEMKKRPASTPKAGGVATTRKGNIKRK